MNPILLFALVVLAFLSLSAMKSATQTPPVDAKALVQAGALLIDVRTPEEFQSGHVEGAKNIPVSELDQRIGEFGPKEGMIVLYCRSGGRAGKAKSQLEAAGYMAVHNAGGIADMD
jgi:phage shock protein E